MKRALVGIPLGAAITVSLFSVSWTTSLCGCLTPAMVFGGSIGSVLVYEVPDTARDKFLRKLPIGSTESQIRDVLGSAFHNYCRAAQSSTGFECLLEEREDGTVLTRYREGFRVDINLDANRQVKDVQFGKYRREVGMFGAG